MSASVDPQLSFSISSCPICAKKGIEGYKTCPQCQSNLHAFSIVSKLSQQPPPASSSPTFPTPPSSLFSPPPATAPTASTTPKPAPAIPKPSLTAPTTANVTTKENPTPISHEDHSYKDQSKENNGKYNKTKKNLNDSAMPFFHSQKDMEFFIPQTASGWIHPKWVFTFTLGMTLILLTFLTIIFYLYQNQTHTYMALLSESLMGKHHQSTLATIEAPPLHNPQHFSSSSDTNNTQHINNANQTSTLSTKFTATTTAPSETPNEAPSDKYLEYIFKNGDTLWGIARTNWNHGYYYPILLEKNPWLSLFGDNTGLRLQVLKDINQVRRDYQNLIVHMDGLESATFFKYRVRPQDTWEKVAKNFLGKEDSSFIKHLNSNKLHPGTRILIPLEQ